MYITIEELNILKAINIQYKDEELAELIRVFEERFNDGHERASSKVKEMRKKYRFYGRSKTLKNNYFSKELDVIDDLISKKRYSDAIDYFEELKSQNSWNDNAIKEFLELNPLVTSKIEDLQKSKNKVK